MKKMLMLLLVVCIMFLVSHMKIYAVEGFDKYPDETVVQSDMVDGSVIVNGDGNFIFYNTETSELHEQSTIEETKNSKVKQPNLTFSFPIPIFDFLKIAGRKKNNKKDYDDNDETDNK